MSFQSGISFGASAPSGVSFAFGKSKVDAVSSQLTMSLGTFNAQARAPLKFSHFSNILFHFYFYYLFFVVF
jgi:hypothetical protein